MSDREHRWAVRTDEADAVNSAAVLAVVPALFSEPTGIFSVGSALADFEARRRARAIWDAEIERRGLINDIRTAGFRGWLNTMTVLARELAGVDVVEGGAS